MKKIIALIVVFLFNCQNNDRNALKNTENEYISALLQKGMQKNVPLELRYSYLNRALSLTDNNDSLKCQILFSKCNLHYKAGQYDSLFLNGATLKTISENTSNFLQLGKYYHLVANYQERVMRNIDSAFYYNNLSKNQFVKINDSLRISRRMVRLGYLQRSKGDYFGAKETLTEALPYISPIDSNNLANLFNELGTIHAGLKNLPDAISYYHQAINTSVSADNILIYKNNLAVDLLNNISSNGEAVAIFEELLSNRQLSKDSINLARVLNYYAYGLWKKGEKNTENYFSIALNIRKKYKYTADIIDSHLKLGEIYLKEAPLISKKHLDTAIQLSKKNKLPREEANALSFLMQLEPASLYFKDRYIFLKDSLYNNELKVKTQFAKMKYDDAQKKKDILKLETETAQKRAQLAEQKTQKIIFVSLSGFLLLGGSTLLFLILQRHKKEKLLEIYNTEKRISRDLHDGLANDIFGFMTKLQSEDTNKETWLNHLEMLYETARQISHENSAIKTGPAFIEELNTLINNYQSSSISILTKGMTTINWPALNEHKCVIVHRSIKELLVNMKKHAQANLVSLQFQHQKKQLRIIYSDNGIGFNDNNSYGIGLLNTENRIHSVGGRIIFDSKPGRGAKVMISIPFNR